MKILLVHNYYQQSGGEDIVFKAEAGLLRAYGHDIRLFTVFNDSLTNAWNKVKAAVKLPYSKTARRKLSRELKIFKPDVVHVHNFFPLLTVSIYDACVDASIPVVQTLHNYRTICPGALLMRKGILCEDCISKAAYQAVLHGCYRGSRVGSFAVARMVEAHRKADTWDKKVNRFVALTEFARQKFIQAGFPAKKLSVKPNFVSDGLSCQSMKGTTNAHALYVGRLSQEKGIKTMLRAWENTFPVLHVAGDGPMLEDVQGKVGNSLNYLGKISSREVGLQMQSASFLVMPSECYENFPMVLCEAFSHGLPVIASRLGGMAEIVEDGKTGLHFEAGNSSDLVEKVKWMQNHPEVCKKMGENARQVYLEKYTPETNYRILMKIYDEAIMNHV